MRTDGLPRGKAPASDGAGGGEDPALVGGGAAPSGRPRPGAGIAPAPIARAARFSSHARASRATSSVQATRWLVMPMTPSSERSRETASTTTTSSGRGAITATSSTVVAPLPSAHAVLVRGHETETMPITNAATARRGSVTRVYFIRNPERVPNLLCSLRQASLPSLGSAVPSPASTLFGTLKGFRTSCARSGKQACLRSGQQYRHRSTSLVYRHRSIVTGMEEGAGAQEICPV